MQQRLTQLNEYTSERNSLVREVAPRPEDKIELEIGDTKSDEFIPQAKIIRWDNETNFSIRRDNGARSFIERDGKIVAESRDENVVIYELEPDEQNEDGGLEIEIELPRRPKTNIFEFTLQTKGLNFYYQPALTAEEIAKGASQPENVIGSYAVYHATERNNRVGGKHYKTGKAFHIYRPEAIDANGDRTWCELNIDEQAGVLTVTVPQDWLNRASYPVRVDPTFGYTSIGSTSQAVAQRFSSFDSAVRKGTVFTTSEAGVLVSLTAAMSINAVRNVTTAFVVNEFESGGANTHQAVATLEQVFSHSTSATLRTIDANGELLNADTDYILSAVGDPLDMLSDGSLNLWRDSSSGAWRQRNVNTLNFPNAYNEAISQDPWVTDFSNTSTWSVFATYTAAPSEEPPTVTTGAVTDIAETTATGNGNVTDDGGATITERGVCWATTATPTTADSKATSAGTTGAFTASMTGLTANTLYYVRAYAINSEGTSYGDEVTFTTLSAVSLPTVVTHPVTNIQETP